VFRTETLRSESETDPSPVNSKYIQNVFRRKVPRDHTFGEYHDTGGSFKIVWSKFKYNDKYVFVDGKSTTQRNAKSVGISNKVTT
jgi:hypothetical protein